MNNKKELQLLIKLYCKLEKEILNELSELKCADSECDCDDRSVFDYIHYGEYAEIMKVCSNCGGFINDIYG